MRYALPPGVVAELHDARHAHGFTQQQLAGAVGVHRVTLARFENGTRRPSRTCGRVIADVLDLSDIARGFLEAPR